jgi:DNA-binding NtrC family response regulator
MDDVPLLARHFVRKHAPDREIIISKETMARLMSYSWPGNVRELENVVQCGLAVRNGNVLHIENTPIVTGGNGLSLHYREELKKGRTMKEILAGLETQMIREMLADQGGNRSSAARLLGVHRRYLYSKMKQYKIR